jgi:uncharacterized protein (TIGR02391 family)
MRRVLRVRISPKIVELPRSAKSAEAIENYATWLRETKGLAPNTVRLYVLILRRLAHFAEERKRGIAVLSRADIEAFVKSQSHYDNDTQAQIRAPIVGFYNYLSISGGRSDNPAKSVQFAKKRGRPPRPRGHLAHRLAKLPPHYARMVPVVSELLEAGLSLQEIFDIDEGPRVPTNIQIEHPRKGLRIIRLSEPSRKLLEEWGGQFPIKQRAFQRALQPYGVTPKELADPRRPGLSDLHRNLLPEGSLHPSLEARAIPPYIDRQYDTSVLMAMKAVEVAVRRAGSYAPSDLGVNLMRKAFNPDRGPLSNPRAEMAEREGVRDLFVGAMGAIKNPLSHREDVIWTDPFETAGVIRFADVLLRHVDTAAAR